MLVAWALPRDDLTVDKVLHLGGIRSHDLLMRPQSCVLGRQRDVSCTLVLFECHAAGFRRCIVKLVALGLLQVDLLKAGAEHDVLVRAWQEPLTTVGHRL